MILSPTGLWVMDADIGATYDQKCSSNGRGTKARYVELRQTLSNPSQIQIESVQVIVDEADNNNMIIGRNSNLFSSTKGMNKQGKQGKLEVHSKKSCPLKTKADAEKARKAKAKAAQDKKAADDKAAKDKAARDKKAAANNKVVPGMVIALKGGKDNKYCADEGETIRCNRGGVGSWEKFIVMDGGGGKIALKGGRNKKFCADEGSNGIKCNRGGVGGWEKFTVEMLGGGKLALKGGKDNKYCADEGSMIKCNRGGVGSWEKFTFEVLGCKGKVQTFQHGGFNGKRVLFGKGNYDYGRMTRMGQRNDDMSSLKVPSGCKVIAYQHGSFNGKAVTFGPGNYDHGRMTRMGQRNDDMSSLKVTNALIEMSSFQVVDHFE